MFPNKRMKTAKVRFRPDVELLEDRRLLSGAPVESARGLGLSCVPINPADGIPYTQCDGKLASFDLQKIDVRLTIPDGATAALPTILILPFWTGDKTSFSSEFKDRDPNKSWTYRWNTTWFASKGYATLSYTPRGWGQSGGPDDLDAAQAATSWTHIMDRNWEVRDSQHLLGMLVDHSIADAARLVASGESAGGGQTWMLATALPWDTPAEGTRLIHLTAAVPMYSWTDWQNFLAPNGRATDHHTQNASHESPHGVPKESFIDFLYATAATSSPASSAMPRAKINHSNPSELHSYFDGWMAFWRAGEPYDTSELLVPDPQNADGMTTIDAAALAAALRSKSAYYADDYFAALGSGAAPAVPIFAMQNWMDPYATPVEALQMYRKLKAIDSEYPLYIGFGSGGHLPGSYPVEQREHLHDQANEFLDAYVLHGGGGAPAMPIFSFPTSVPSPSGAPTVFAANWDGMTRSAVTLRHSDSRHTASGPPNPLLEVPMEPLLGLPITQGPGTYSTENAWTWEVPSTGFTLLGLPTLSVSYALTGRDATVIPRLWDVASDGTRTLVCRGVYRLSVAGGDQPSGIMNFQLFGNHYNFAPGNKIQLEVSQTDAPYFKPDSELSSITFSSPELILPTVERIRKKDNAGTPQNSKLDAPCMAILLMEADGTSSIYLSNATVTPDVNETGSLLYVGPDGLDWYFATADEEETVLIFEETLRDSLIDDIFVEVPSAAMCNL